MSGSQRDSVSRSEAAPDRRPDQPHLEGRGARVFGAPVQHTLTATGAPTIRLRRPRAYWTLCPRIAWTGLFLMLGASRGLTQTAEPTTRAGVIAHAQEEKAREAEPYVPNRAEAMFQRFEQEGFPFIGTPSGFYPALASVYPGGGLALGAGYRTFTGQSAVVDVHALYSIATYKRVETSFRSPGHARGRLAFGARAGWMDAPRVNFFGLGGESTRQNASVFRLREFYGEGTVAWRPSRWFQLSGLGGYERFSDSSGTGPRQSIEERFTAATAPRLGEDPAYARSAVTALLLWTDTPAYSRRGGLLEFTYDGRARLDEGGGFGLTRTEIVQHIPVLRENWVISLRGRSDNVVGRAANAPYFLLPALGNGSTLRAFQTDRFRDRNSLLLTGEWRWIPSRLALDMALFVDAGRVGPTWKDVRSGGLKTDYGIGVRFHAPAATALRIDFARGPEGMRLVFASSAPF